MFLTIFREWLQNLLCKHEFQCTSALIDQYGKRECLCCKKCGIKRVQEIKNESNRKSD